MAEVFNLYKRAYSYYNLTMGYNSDAIDNYTRNNLPMYNTDIKLYKGIPNTIQFSIRDQDRKAVSYNGKLSLVILNKNMEFISKKDLDIVNAKRGLYSAHFSEIEMRDLEPIHYIGHVEIVDDENKSIDMLYSGEKWNPYIDINVIKNNMEIFNESIEVGGWMNSNPYVDKESGIAYDIIVSERVKSDITQYHTLSVSYDKDFIGTIYFEASTQDLPSDNDWTVVDEYEVSELPNEEKTDNTIGFSREFNCLWIRVSYKKEQNNTGKITKVLYRN